MRKTATPRGYKKKADDLFSKIIRSKNYCDRCGKGQFLQCAHIVSRRFSATRCDLRNALCLCARCHHYFTDHPVEFGRFVINKIGDELYDELQKLAHKPTKVDWKLTYEELKKIYEDLTRDSGGYLSPL